MPGQLQVGLVGGCLWRLQIICGLCSLSCSLFHWLLCPEQFWTGHPPIRCPHLRPREHGQNFLKLETGYSCFSFQLFEVFCHSSACSHTNGAHMCVHTRANTFFPILIFWDTFNSSFYKTSTPLIFLCPESAQKISVISGRISLYREPINTNQFLDTVYLGTAPEAIG